MNIKLLSVVLLFSMNSFASTAPAQAQAPAAPMDELDAPPVAAMAPDESESREKPAVKKEVAAEISLRPQDVHVSDVRKTNVYKSDGVFIGGDQVVKQIRLSNIRHSAQKDFERLVLDLEGSDAGLPAALRRPPYYQVAIEPAQNRIMATVWGDVGVKFDPALVTKSFAKSKLISKVETLPKTEKDRWSFVIHLKREVPVEVFELSQPTRVVVDFKK